MSEDDEFVIEGPSRSIPNISLGKLMHDNLQNDHTEEEALVDAFSGKSITFEQIFGKSCALASALLAHKYGIDSVIALCSENTIEYFTPILAALYVGAITVPINPAYTLQEIEHVLGISLLKVVFCSKLTCDKFVQLKEKFTCIEKIVVINSDNTENLHGAEIMNSFIRNSLRSNLYLQNFPKLANLDCEQQVALILSSSGTTGLPKGVMITHKNLITRLMLQMENFTTVKGDVTLGTIPFFHAYGLLRGIGSIFERRKVIAVSRFEPEIFLKLIETYKVNFLMLVPPLVVFLTKSPLVEKYDLSSVKKVICGAASLSQESVEKLRKRLNLDSFRQGYGLTETCAGTIATPEENMKDGSVGVVLQTVKCKIRHPETFKSLGPNQVGEICFKGPLVMKGYYRNEEATRNAFTSDGWLLTGDLGYYDEDRYFYIVDRLKELIKYKGFQVAPSELENILLKNRKVMDAGVVGVPNEEAGELPLAFVVTKPNEEVTPQEIEKYVSERVSPHKKLRGGVIFVKEIPKNPSGKILRRKLKELLEKHTSKL